MPKTKNDFITSNDLKIFEDKLSKKFLGSLEEFAGQIIKATQKGFEEVGIRFDRVENRLDGVENRLDGVENRLDGVENRLDGVESGLRDVKRQLTNLQMDTPTSREFFDHEKRIKKLENKIFINQ